MIRRDVFLKVRIRLHGHDILDGGENRLDEAVQLGNVGELRVEDFGHERTGVGHVVDLSHDG